MDVRINTALEPCGTSGNGMPVRTTVRRSRCFGPDQAVRVIPGVVSMSSVMLSNTRPATASKAGEISSQGARGFGPLQVDQSRQYRRPSSRRGAELRFQNLRLLPSEQGQFLFGDEFNRINELSRDATRHQIRLSRSKNWLTINRLNKNRTGGRLELKLALPI